MRVERYDRSFELHPVTTFTTDSTVTLGPVADVSDLRSGMLLLWIYAKSGTVSFVSWLLGCADGDDAVFDLAFDRSVAYSATQSAGTVSSVAARNGPTLTAAGRVALRYDYLPAPKIRLAYYLTGTTPSVTFSAFFTGEPVQ
jgi:hypothetical protein